MRKNWIILIGLALLWLGCGGDTRTLSHSVKGQTFELMGPLFAGPNTAQATFSPDVAATLAAENAGEAELVGVRLRSAILRMPAGQSFAGVEEAVLQLVADDAEMTQAAVLNPVPQDKSEISLTVSEEADLLKIFQQEQAYLVIDLGLAEDLDTSLVVMGDFVFDLIVE